VGECSWSAQERTDSTLLPPAETSVGSRVGYKKSLSLLAETIFRCDTAFDLDFPMVTPLPGGFWDTPNPYIIKNDSDKNDDSKHIMIEVCATDCGCSGCKSRLSYPSSNSGNGADQESELNVFDIDMDAVPTLDMFDVNGDKVT
jgi:hypothetical protein